MALPVVLVCGSASVLALGITHVLAVLALPASSHSLAPSVGPRVSPPPCLPTPRQPPQAVGPRCLSSYPRSCSKVRTTELTKQLSSLRNWPVVIVCNRHVLAIPRMRGGPTTPPTWPVVCRAGNPRNPCHAPSC